MQCIEYRSVAVLALLFFLPGAAQAQQNGRSRSLPVTVHGQVRFAHGGAPAENVLIRLERFAGGVEGELMTDRTGKYQFSGMAPGIYVITLHLPGFVDQRREVDLQTTSSEYLLFQLLPQKPAAAAKASVPVTGVVDANAPLEARQEFDRALLALDGKRMEDAARHLERAVTVYPKFLRAQLRLGTIYMDLGEWNKAEASLRRVLEIDPKTANAFFALGELYLQEKQDAEAEKALRAGLALENRSWQGHFTLGHLYWQKGEVVRAARQVAIAIQLNPNHAEAHLLAGNIFLRAGKRDDALAEFQEYLNLAPKGRYFSQAKEAIEKIKASLGRTTQPSAVKTMRADHK